MSAPRLDDQLCFALYSASRLMVRAYGPVLDALGLTYTQYLAMLVLWEADDERAVRVGLTEAGRAPATRAAGVPEAVLCGLGEQPENLVALRDVLVTLNGRLSGS